MELWWKNKLGFLWIISVLLHINIFADGPNNSIAFDSTNINATVVTDFPAEQLSMLSGNLEYLYRDVYIPGPNGMDVEIYRKFSQNYSNDISYRHMPARWDLEFPKIHTFKSDNNNRSDENGGSGNINICFDANNISVSMNGISYSSVVGHNSTSDLPIGVDRKDSISFSNNAVLECKVKPVLWLADGRKVEFGLKDTSGTLSSGGILKVYYADNASCFLKQK
jgi:hypothetical protein